MDKWPLIHDYHRMVRREVLSPLVCPEDGIEMTVKIGKDDEPEFKCPECVSSYRPGKDFYDQVVNIRDLRNV